MASDPRHQLALEAPAALAVGESLGGDHDAAHPDLCALLDRVEAGLGAQRDHGEVDGPGDLGDPRPGASAPQLERLAGDEVDGAGVAGSLQRGEEAAADGIAVGGDPHQEHGLGVEQPLHGARLGAVLPLRHHREGPGGGVDPEGHHDHPVVEGAVDVEARLGEDLDHLRVLREHLGGEHVDALLPRGGREVLEQHGPQSRALPGVGDVEGDLRRARGGPVVAADGDDVLPHEHDEGDPVAMVHGGEAGQVPLGQPRHRREEPQVPRVLGLALVEGLERLGVLGQDRAQVRGRAVAQGDVRLPVRGIGRAGVGAAPGTSSQ